MTDYFVHPHGIVEPGAQIGAGTRVWAFSHILPGAKIGADCNICDNCFVENDVVIGDRVTVKPFVPLPDGMRVEDDVFIGPNAAFTNDRFPRSKGYEFKVEGITLRKGATIGANAVVLPGVTVGRYAMVGSGAVVSNDVPPNAIVMGVPARVVGFVNSERNGRLKVVTTDGKAEELSALGVQIVRLQMGAGEDGNVAALDFANSLPFAVSEYSLVQDVPSHVVRGGSAQREQTQFFTCVRGSCHLVVEDGRARSEVRLDAAGVGVIVPPLRWASQYKFSADAVLMILSSIGTTNEIRDYEIFLSLVGAS